MTATVKHYIEFDNGAVSWRHEITDRDHASYLNSVEGFACRVTGPDHDPYWLRTDGTISKKAPRA